MYSLPAHTGTAIPKHSVLRRSACLKALLFTEYYGLVVDDPAFIPEHPLFLVLKPLQDEINRA